MLSVFCRKQNHLFLHMTFSKVNHSNCNTDCDTTSYIKEFIMKINLNISPSRRGKFDIYLFFCIILLQILFFSSMITVLPASPKLLFLWAGSMLLFLVYSIMISNLLNIIAYTTSCFLFFLINIIIHILSRLYAKATPIYGYSYYFCAITTVCVIVIIYNFIKYKIKISSTNKRL